VVLDTVPPTVEATYSTVRLTPTSADLLAIDRAATSSVVGKMRIEDADGSFSGAPVELRLIATITPAPSGEAASLRTLDGVDAHVDLFRSTFHAALTGGGLLEGAVDRLGAIVDRTTVARLTVPRGVEGLAAADGCSAPPWTEPRPPGPAHLAVTSSHEGARTPARPSERDRGRHPLPLGSGTWSQRAAPGHG
jgi:hypothetical protein